MRALGETHRWRPSTQRVLTLFLALAAALSPSAALFAGPVVLGKLEIHGLKLLSEERVAQASGLRLDEPVTVEDLKAAAQRLGQSGFFSSLRFRYQVSAGRMTAIFDVQEATVFRTCVFENFVGIPDSELNAALQRAIPLYAGQLPLSGTAIDTATSALEELLEKRGVTAEVSSTDFMDLNTQQKRLLFEIPSEVMEVAGLEFEGAVDVKPDVLMRAARQLVGQRYSRTAAVAFFRLSLLPIYRERGYLEASFGEFTTRPETPSDRERVVLTIPVTEGPQYRWMGADWQGNTLFSADELDKLLDMQEGKIADGVHLDEGLTKIREAYGQLGHIGLQLRAQAHYVRKQAEVSFSYELTEGPTYRMGKLSIQGAPAGTEQKYRRAWKLESGAVFDSTYPQSYAEELARIRLAIAGPTRLVPNPATLVVDVTIQIR